LESIDVRLRDYETQVSMSDENLEGVVHIRALPEYLNSLKDLMHEGEKDIERREEKAGEQDTDATRD